MALNLTRNTKVYFTSLTATAGFTNANAAEVQVMEGYSLVQNTDTQVIQPNEAGATPVRGSRTFNTALQPVDWSFSTYIRPQKPSQVTAVESYLWNAIAGKNQIVPFASYTNVTTATRANASATVATATGTFAAGIVAGDTINFSGFSPANWDGQYVAVSANGTTSVVYTVDATGVTGTTAAGTVKAATGQWFETTANARLAFEGSNVQTLVPFSLIFKIDNTYYRIDNCAVDQATIDFGLDQIAMIKWSGKGTRVYEYTNTTGISELNALTAPVTTANYITNKLSTVALTSNIGGVSGTAYTVPLTSGSITISNNLNYLTPKNLNVVNQPIGYYTGARSISGTMSAYLRSGTAGDTGSLWSALLAASTASTETKFALVIALGGAANAVRVEFDMQAAFLQIPTMDAQDIVSTNIAFSAQGYSLPTSANTYDLTKANDLVVRYYSS